MLLNILYIITITIISRACSIQLSRLLANITIFVFPFTNNGCWLVIDCTQCLISVLTKGKI